MKDIALIQNLKKQKQWAYCSVGCKWDSLTDDKFIGVEGPCAENGVTNVGKLNIEPVNDNGPCIEFAWLFMLLSDEDEWWGGVSFGRSFVSGGGNEGGGWDGGGMRSEPSAGLCGVWVNGEYCSIAFFLSL